MQGISIQTLMIMTLDRCIFVSGSCSAAGYNICCASGSCKGESPISSCYCDKLCHTFKDCCPDANALCQKDKTAGSN